MYVSLSDTMDSLSRDVVNLTKNGECSNCGGCCVSYLPMTKLELKTIVLYVKRHRIPIVKIPSVGHTIDITCPFRDYESKKCLIYEVRPAICREFICSQSKKVIETNKNKYFSDKRYLQYDLREVFK